MSNCIEQPAQAKSLNYGQCQALKVLVADKMGLKSLHVDDAQKMMRGDSVHPIVFASVERQATLAHNEFAGDAEKVAQANRVGLILLAEYGLT